MTVACSGAGHSFGTIPPEAWRPDGSVDMSLVPDYVQALDRDGNVAGYVRAEDILGVRGVEEPPTGPIPVVDRQLVQVGWMVPDAGFVPLGTPIEKITTVPVTVAPTG